MMLAGSVCLSLMSPHRRRFFRFESLPLEELPDFRYLWTPRRELSPPRTAGGARVRSAETKIHCARIRLLKFVIIKEACGIKDARDMYHMSTSPTIVTIPFFFPSTHSPRKKKKKIQPFIPVTLKASSFSRISITEADDICR